MFGPAAGAEVTVAPLHDQANVIYEGTTWDSTYLSALFGAETWDGYDSLARLLVMGIVLPVVNEVDPAALYVVTASGGEDPDYDGNYIEDPASTPLGSTIHAVMTGEQLLAGNAFISPVTEIGYQWIKYNWEYHDDPTILSDLDYVATQFLTDANEDGTVDRKDMLSYNRMLAPAHYKWDMTYLDNLTVVMAGGGTDMEVEDAVYEAIDGRSYDHGGGSDNWNEPGNDHLEGADFLGSFDTEFSLSILGYLTEEDFRDYAYITVDVPMDVTVWLSPPMDADYDLGLWLDGAHVAGSGLGTGETEEVTYQLDAGDDLYFEAIRWEGEGEYFLDFQLTPR